MNTSLLDIAPRGMVHLTAEYGGKRYYLSSHARYHEAEDSLKVGRSKYPPDASFYTTDRNCCINGTAAELAAIVTPAQTEMNLSDQGDMFK